MGLSLVGCLPAAMNASLAFLSFGIGIYIWRIQRGPDRHKISFWLAGFCLLGFAGLAGSLRHGIDLSRLPALDIFAGGFDLYQVLAVGMFLCGAIYDLYGPEIARHASPVVTLVGFAFFLAARQLPVPAILIAIYETLAMLPVFVFYSWLATRFHFHGARWISFGTVLFILAVLLQASRTTRFDWIPLVSPNDFANAIRALGLFALALGLRSALLPLRGRKIDHISPLL